MRRKQRRDENRVDGETYRPCTLRHHQIGREAPERHAQRKFKIHETPGERQAIEEHECREAGELDTPLDNFFKRKCAADNHQLAQQQKQPGRRFDAGQTCHLRDQQIHRQIGIERPGHLVMRVGIGSAVLAQNIHAGEMIEIINHRRNGRE
jgi:hypothetical protein